jgi:hypothetical protein
VLDEVAVRNRRTLVPDGAVLDVLPPVAGGLMRRPSVRAKTLVC